MNRVFHLVAIAALVIATPLAFGEDEVPSDAEMKAVKAVQFFIRQNRLFPWSEDQRCLSIIVGDETRNYYDIEVHSNNAACGGDPNVSPGLAMFRVMRKGNSVRCFSDDWSDGIVPCRKTRAFQSKAHSASKLPNPAVQGTLRDKAAQRP